MTFPEEVAARTLYGEARGEPETGQRAVAHVLRNRVLTGKWGPNLATVCMAPAQFSCWNRDDPNRFIILTVAEDDPLLKKLREIIDISEIEGDPTGNATHYFADTMIKPPAWSIGATFCCKIGRHNFYKDVR